LKGFPSLANETLTSPSPLDHCTMSPGFALGVVGSTSRSPFGGLRLNLIARSGMVPPFRSLLRRLDGEPHHVDEPGILAQPGKVRMAANIDDRIAAPNRCFERPQSGSAVSRQLADQRGAEDDRHISRRTLDRFGDLDPCFGAATRLREQLRE